MLLAAALWDVREHCSQASFAFLLEQLGAVAGKFPQPLWEADHIVPRSLGGKDELGNLRTLCLACHKEVTEILRKNT